MSVKKIAVVGLMTVLSGCSDLDVPDLQRPSLDALTNSPTPAGIIAAAPAVLDGARRNAGTIVANLGMYGREGWNLDPSNPQNINNVLVILDPDAGSGFWLQTYADFRQANTVLAAVDAVGSQMTEQQKEGVRGFIKTMKAYELLWTALIFDDSGVALDVNATPNDPLVPLSTKTEAFTRVAALLDEGRTHLNAAGATFVFGLPAGFASFNTPAQMLKVNRAIRARMNVLTGNYAAALTDLQGSFLDRSASLQLGIFYDYSGNSGDFAQPVFDPTTRQRYAHQSFLQDAKLRADGSKDLRTAKVEPITPLSRTGINVSEKLVVYTSNTAQIPIIRNEELILLRAEARFRTGDRAGALDDVNFIRTTAGGLAAITDPGDPGLLNEIFYNRRYSLFWEQGVRWIDARRTGTLTSLPRDRTDAKFWRRLAIPRNECTQRSPTPAGCTADPGV